jgi:hypothetical protein
MMSTSLQCRGATSSGGVVGGHGHGGVSVGSGPAGSRSGAPAGGRGGAVGGSSVAAPGKGKQTRVVLDDDEVSFDEDEPLQKRLRQLSGVRPAVLDEVAAANNEATDKRAAEEATTMRVAEERAAAKKDAKERAAEEAAVKAAAA